MALLCKTSTVADVGSAGSCSGRKGLDASWDLLQAQDFAGDELPLGLTDSQSQVLRGLRGQEGTNKKVVCQWPSGFVWDQCGSATRLYLRTLDHGSGGQRSCDCNFHGVGSGSGSKYPQLPKALD